ncbi:hypothetical protein KIL84_015060, partial [Mauremys mutica]
TEICSSHKKDNVSSKAIKPTWVPFSSTLSAEERLSFSLHLMNGSERPSNGFQLGEVMHIQADVSTGNHVALRLFVATLTPDRDSSPRYAVIDFNGCLVDGRSDDTTSALHIPQAQAGHTAVHGGHVQVCMRCQKLGQLPDFCSSQVSRLSRC